MANFFKYCTKEQEFEFLNSLHLGDIRTLYTVSNQIHEHYEYLEIPKKSGGKRKLTMPDSLLKNIQKNILKHVLYGFSISNYAKAYHKNADILENAIPHVGKKQILKLDLKHFFDSITFDMVKELVFKEIYFPETIRTLLTILCCYQNKLPQGAPTSPTISNIILKEFDERIGSWCLNHNITYTRYCDDLTFSGEFNKDEIITLVKQELQEYGFQLNTKKTKLLTRENRQIVTGIVVNEKPNTTRMYRKEIRKQMYYIKQHGIENHLQFLKLDIDIFDYLETLKGKTLFVLHVDPKNQEFLTYLKEIKELEKK